MTKEKLEEATKKYQNNTDRYNLVIDDVMLIDVIEQILNESPHVVKYNLYSAEMFDSPGYSCGYIVASWLENGENLYTEIYEWEMY